KGAIHSQLGPIGQHIARMTSQRFDIAKDVVPTTAVESGDMRTQLPDDFIHLESRREGFNHHRGFDRALCQTDTILREYEHVVPETRFLLAFDLWQVVERPASDCSESATAVPDVEPEIKQRCRDWLPLNKDIGLLHVKSTWTNDK